MRGSGRKRHLRGREKGGVRRMGKREEGRGKGWGLPPVFNMPKSQLQCYAESVYCTSSDLLNNLNSGKTPLDRLLLVVAWSISTIRPLNKVSHHPPVSALHATDDKENIEMTWCHSPVSKFTGTSVETKVHGKRQLKLHNHGETYEMDSPNLVIRILPISGTDWVGNVSIRCLETGLVAELNYIGQSFFGFRADRRLIKGKIFDSWFMKILYRLEETALVWGELSQAILSKDWEKARETKKSVEERQREVLRERESRGKNWVPKHLVSYSKEEGWECSPIHKSVPNAPIATL
ncbi:hypothetical protein JHK82_035836 [Glycine max]|nr:hypothetical protein JHK86_035969 [Glycine max]KAG5112567.1 hypothetical protein JHK82_035836 [Glycine max]